jgi:O-antigen/teichoic acid export membrane protein
MAQSVAARVLYGMGQLRWFARAVIAEAVVNFLLSLAMVGPLGIEGVALGTSIPNVINNLLILGYVCRVVGLEYSFYLKRAWLAPTLWGVVLAFGWWTTEALIPTRTWTSLLATGFSGLSAFWAIAGISELGLEPLLKLSRSVIGSNSRATPSLVAEEYVGE